MRTPLRVSGYLIAVVLAVACAGLPSEPAQTPEDPATGQQDGTTTIAEFESDIRVAVQLAEEYWQEAFSSGQFVPIRRVVPYEDSGDVECANEPIPGNNAVYCPAGDFIAYDVDWAVAAFRQIGDAFLYFLLGHEYAHGIQVRLGIQHEFTIEQELQADCMAGAYIGDSVRANRLRLDTGDLDEFRDGLAAVGDDPDQPWFSPGAHGSAEQRIDAFSSGYDSSLGACDLG